MTAQVARDSQPSPRRSSLALGIGRRLRQEREMRRITLCEVAAACRITHQQVSRIERGMVNVPIQTLARLAGAYGLTLAQLVEGVNYAPRFLARSSATCGACGGALPAFTDLVPV